MEVIVGVGIGVFIGLLAGSRKRRRNRPQTISTGRDQRQDKLKQADEELITVILPTINNDK